MSETDAPTTAEAPAEKRTNDPFAPFRAEIMHTVIKPKMRAAKQSLVDAGTPVTKAEWHREFCKLFESGISAATFNNWIADCGFTVKKAITVVDEDPAPSA